MAEDSNGAATAKETEPRVEATTEVSQSAATIKEETSGPSPTLREIFSLPDKDDDDADERWRSFKEKVSQEVKGIKWTATVPDLATKLAELLDVKIPDVLITAWKKVGDIQAVLEKSKKTPDETIYLELTQHTINSEHKPSIDVKIKGVTVKKIELLIQLGFNLKSFLLKVQNGAITEMQTGECEAKGTIKYGKLTVAEKKMEPIKLPFSIPISPALFDPPEREAEDAEAAEDAEELERIEI